MNHYSFCSCNPSISVLHLLFGKVAFQSGDDETLRLLLEAGADPEEGNGAGKTAIEIAQEANVNGSHLHVLSLLRRAIQINMVSF